MLPKLNTLEVQEGKLGRLFRQIGLRKNLQKPSMWLNKVEYWHWIFTFKYVECGSFFEIEVDYQNKFVSKTSL